MAGLRFVTHATIADHVSTSAGCRVAMANDRSLLSRAACSTACQICTACAPRSPKVLQQWHAFATLRGPYVGCKSLAQRDAVEHFDGVHACVNLPIASGWMPDSAPRAVVKAFSGENIREINPRMRGERSARIAALRCPRLTLKRVLRLGRRADQ